MEIISDGHSWHWRGLGGGYDDERLHEYTWRMHSGCLGDLWRAFRGGNSLAWSPGPTSCRSVRCTLTLGFGRLRFGLRGASVPDKFTQELELGQEELPDYIPTWWRKKGKTYLQVWWRCFKNQRCLSPCYTFHVYTWKTGKQVFFQQIIACQSLKIPENSLKTHTGNLEYSSNHLYEKLFRPQYDK